MNTTTNMSKNIPKNDKHQQHNVKMHIIRMTIMSNTHNKQIKNTKTYEQNDEHMSTT